VAHADNSLAQHSKTRAASRLYQIGIRVAFDPHFTNRTHAVLRALRAGKAHACAWSRPMPKPNNIVAVVDDDDLMREALQNLLLAFDYEVELYESAEAFLAARATTNAGCLVSDIHLGGMTGIDLGRALKASGARLPIIFMTASTDPGLRARAMDLGCVAFLGKPFPPLALAEALNEALDRCPTA
jgi:CheY-like chemotaxis protein